MTEEEPVGRRRRILGAAAVAAVGGLAGCFGGSDGGDDPSDTDDASDDGDGDSAGARTCTDVTDGYEAEDVGDRPMFFDFEYPALFGQLVYDTTSTQVIAGSEQDLPEEAFLEILLQQSTDTESEPPEVTNYEELETGFSLVTNFDGEEVEFAGSADPDRAQVFVEGNLPYEVDGERSLFRTKISILAQNDSAECTEALREATEHVVESLAVNGDTTLGQ
ncbi:hypothetical protein [Natronomonas marina]|jgi:hypothetical protein|uniref:hypothetical protein n=1 Tax=Natronomonas marina TaxID=2961939 RepID=UPI0020CA1661|nr:hypothetical protein [Natronomonas marina]